MFLDVGNIILTPDLMREQVINLLVDSFSDR